MARLISTDELAGMLGAPGLVVVDATYHALDPARYAAAEFAAGHIPGAHFLDLATLADAESPLPGMRPDAEHFAERMAAIGVGDGARVVLYDLSPHLTSARAWWLMRGFGIAEVMLLDGGIAKWRREGRPIEQGAGAAAAGATFTRHVSNTRVRDLDAMRANLTSHAAIVVDARSPSRFSGVEADPRSGVAPGHIPGSYNLPYGELLHADGTWKRGTALRAAFEEAGVDLDRPLVMTCGSGVTAAVLLFGAALLGKDDVALYDGSWSEWGADPDTPKATGA